MRRKRTVFEKLLLSEFSSTSHKGLLCSFLCTSCVLFQLENWQTDGENCCSVTGCFWNLLFLYVFLFFFLQYAAPFHLFCSICLIYRGGKRNEDNTGPAVVCWEKCVIEENNQKEIGLYFSIDWNSWSYFSKILKFMIIFFSLL